MESQPRKRIARTWPVLLLLLPAFVAIWGGWVGLGEKTGFGLINLLPGMGDEPIPALGTVGYSWAVVNTAITLPIGLETYAAYALHVFLNATRKGPLRTFAGWSALSSLILGGGGQVAYHIMEAEGIERAPIWVTAIVGSLPVLVLGMGTTLAALVKRAEDGQEEQTPKRSLAERVAAARATLDATLEAAKAPVTPKGSDIGAVPAPCMGEVHGPEAPVQEGPKPEPKVPAQRRTRTDWDAAKAVQMILDGAKDAEVSAAVGTGPKNIQRVRRAVVALRQDPQVEIPPSWKVPGPALPIIREEVRRWTR